MALSFAQTRRILTSAVRGGGGGGGGGGDYHHHEQQSYFCRHRPTGLLVSTT